MLKRSMHSEQGTVARVIAFKVYNLPKICEQCKTEGKVHVHHKNQNRDDNTKENITILCRKCHMDLHGIFPVVKEPALSQYPSKDKRFKDVPKYKILQEKRKAATQKYREKWGIK